MQFVKCYKLFKDMFIGYDYDHFPPPPPLALSLVSMEVIASQKMADIRPST